MLASSTGALTLALGGSTLTGLNGIVLSNGQAWQVSLTAVGQTRCYVPGYGRPAPSPGSRTGTGANADGLPLDGAVLLVERNRGVARRADEPLDSERSWLRSPGAAIAASIVGGIVHRHGYATTPAPFTSLASGSVAADRASPSASRSTITGVNGPRTITAIAGNTITVNGGAIASKVAAPGTVALVRIGGDSITLTGPAFAGALSTTPTSITRSTGSWITDGFAIGQQIILGGGLTGVFTITGANATTLNVTGVNGSTLTTQSGVSATATVLPVGAGPGQPFDNYAPLVVYGDTSQDGVWYGGDPHTVSLHNFGPKPMPHIEGVDVTLAKTADGFTGTITRNACVAPACTGSALGFLSDGFAVGQELAIGPPTVTASSAGAVYDIFSDHLTLHTGSWVADGFHVNQQVSIAGLPGTWNVKGFASANGGTSNVLELNGPTLTPLPNQSLTVTTPSRSTSASSRPSRARRSPSTSRCRSPTSPVYRPSRLRQAGARPVRSTSTC